MDLYEVCVNPKCDENKSGTEFAVGASVCPKCGADLEAKDRRSSLTQLISGVKAAFGLSTRQPAPALSPRGDSGQDKVVLTITILGIAPKMFDDADKMSYSFAWNEVGKARPVTDSKLYGDIQDDEVTIGALQPEMTWRPSLDLAAYCAFSPNLDTDGRRIPVAVSRHMCTLYLENGHVLLKAANASNRPHPVDTSSGFTMDRSMPANQTVQLAGGEIFVMGDFIFQFEVQTL